MVAGYSAASGYPRAAIAASSSVMRRRPVPWPRYSGATLTEATPAQGTARPAHHWRRSWKIAAPAACWPANAPRNMPCRARSLAA